MIKQEYIYMTVLTNERYIPGVMALIRSMREVNCRYDLAVMIPENRVAALSEKIEDYGILKLEGVFLMTQPDVVMPDSLEIKNYYWKDTFFKLQAARCTEYKKIILLDCDQMMVRNVDHLLDKPNMTATICGRCVHHDWKRLSSGLLVVEPSEELYQKLLHCIKPAVDRKYRNGLQAGDQDVFQEAFPEWGVNDKEQYIPEIYNVCWGGIDELCKKENCSVKDFFIIHFPGKEKPWDYSTNYYLKIFLVYLVKGNTGHLLYKIKIWKKYRLLCEKI